MPKPIPRKIKESGPRRPTSAEHLARVRQVRRAILHAVVVVLLVGGLAWLVASLRTTVAETAAKGAPPPRVVFANRPAWMTDLVARNLAEQFRPAYAPSVFDRESLVAMNRKLKANPWVSKVRQVRRVFGESAGDTIEVDCEFRAPLALVRDRDGDGYWFVDSKGYKLPERFTEQELSHLIYADGKVNLRVIEGVRNPAPRQAGQLWPGDDLAAGLELAAKLNGQSYAEDVLRVNVTNYGGRVDAREAHLVLVTRLRVKDADGQAAFSRILWGRAWGASDAFIEVKPERKLQAMASTVQRYGRVDANAAWIDIRFDEIYVPGPTAATGPHADGGR
jgi:hypothetical protein